MLYTGLTLLKTLMPILRGGVGYLHFSRQRSAIGEDRGEKRKGRVARGERRRGWAGSGLIGLQLRKVILMKVEEGTLSFNWQS